jgi:molecular chaperone DnaJ
MPAVFCSRQRETGADRRGPLAPARLNPAVAHRTPLHILPGVDGGPAGDVYVVLHVTEHPFFEREGKDLFCAIPISFTQAALGTTVMIPTLDGDVKLTVPEATQTGTSFRIRKKGVPVLNGNGRGDLYVEVKVMTPEKLTKQQRELLDQLAGTLGQKNDPEKRGLLNKMKDMFS